ncbi:hypothetical protein ACFSCX_22560 [Bacillus salitolerans]|uniref:SMI1/KNR4 family protein n=1 Tax=Bacillus salitolerans TaxID=1437434 RepID=A0ABW4LVV7_9BACI
MITFGPYISEREKRKLLPIIEADIEFSKSQCLGSYYFHEECNIWKKAYHTTERFDYILERDCFLELQSAECVPILIGFDDDKYVIYLDVVHGPDLLTYCREEGIGLVEFKDDLIRALTSMLDHGWFYQQLSSKHMIWCEDCQAFFIIDYSNCLKIDLKNRDSYIEKIEKMVDDFVSIHE